MKKMPIILFAALTMAMLTVGCTGMTTPATTPTPIPPITTHTPNANPSTTPNAGTAGTHHTDSPGMTATNEINNAGNAVRDAENWMRSTVR